MDGPHDQYFRESLLETAGHGDGHVLAVAIALLLAILTGRSDLCIAGVFGAGKTRSLAVLLIALSCELEDFAAVVFTKEMLQRLWQIKSATCVHRLKHTLAASLDVLKKAKARRGECDTH